jgi:hypothetical protein
MQLVGDEAGDRAEEGVDVELRRRRVLDDATEA